MTPFPIRASALASDRSRPISRLVRGAVAICAALAALHATAATRSIAVFDCTLIDDNAMYNDAAVNREQQARLALISKDLRSGLGSRGRYRVADNAPAQQLIAQMASKQDLGACGGCEREVGRKLGVDRVGICWVQKVSNLILNINLRIEDVASGATVFQRSVDIRGNNDLSWQRGMQALVRLVADNRGDGNWRGRPARVVRR